MDRIVLLAVLLASAVVFTAVNAWITDDDTASESSSSNSGESGSTSSNSGDSGSSSSNSGGSGSTSSNSGGSSGSGSSSSKGTIIGLPVPSCFRRCGSKKGSKPKHSISGYPQSCGCKGCETNNTCCDDYYLNCALPTLTGITDLLIGDSTTLRCEIPNLPDDCIVTYKFLRDGQFAAYGESQTFNVNNVTLDDDGAVFLCIVFVQGAKSRRSNKLILNVTDENDCESDPCQNGGTCRDLLDEYQCDCVAGYTGVNCELLETPTISGNTNLTEGDNTTLTCNSDIESEDALYQFISLFAGENVTVFEPTSSNQLFLGPVTEVDDNGVGYICFVIVGDDRSDPSDEIVLEVAPVPGALLPIPTLSITPDVVEDGSPFNLICDDKNASAESFIFKRDGVAFATQASDTLTLTADITEDVNYTCTYTKDGVSPLADSNPVKPDVRPATPVLEVTDSTIFVGDDTTFTCTSDPAAPAGATYLFYQGDNVVQESQSNVYTISDAVTSQSGDYRCVVEFNDIESDDSNIVPLTVQLIPAELTIAPVPVEDGNDFILTCDDRGNDATSFTFKRNGNVLSVQPGNTLTVPADIEDEGSYTCTYTVDGLSPPSDSNPVQPTVKPATPVLEVTDSTIFQGDDTTFTCTSDPAAPAGATYLFYQGDNVVQESQSNVYTISDAVTSQSGDYRCVVEFNDNESDDSNTVPLTVQLIPAEITIAPVPVEDGNDFILTCDDRGNDATSFTFKRNGNVLSVQPGNTLTVPADIEDEGSYTCTYTVDGLSPPSDSNPVQPTVKPATPVLEVTDSTIFQGDDTTFTCTSDPAAPAGATYLFYQGDNVVQESQSNVYTISDAVTSQSGDYRCIVEFNDNESDDSNIVPLTVQLLPAELTIAPVPVEDGSDFTLTCDDRGNGATSFTFKGGNVLVVQASSTLTLTADIEDDTIYTCTYTVDDLSPPSDSNPVQPTVKPATPVLEVTDSTIFQGDDTTFTCTSDPAAPAGATYLFYQGDNVVQESQSNVYTISDAVTSQSGDYRCVVEFNDNESDDSNIVPLTVQLLPAELTIAPVPVEDGSDFTLTCDDRGNGATSFTFKGGNVLVVQASSTLTLTADIEDDTIYTCTYTVDDLSPPSDSNPVQPTVKPATPVLEVTDSTIFQGDDTTFTCTSDPAAPAGATYLFYQGDNVVQESQSNVYTISDAVTSQSGDYRCVVEFNDNESDDSNIVPLTVQLLPAELTIAPVPVEDGSDFTLTCDDRGNGATSFTFKGGNVLVVQASSTLTLTADIEDDTIYTCTYTVDDLSPPSDSNPVQPTVKPATPVLEVTDSTIFQGDDTTFTCTSDPAAPAGATYLFYQGDNVVQESQSNVYTISDAVTSQSGDYRCVVEFNDNESDDSNIVPLTVQLLPAELTIAPVPVEDGSDFTLTCDDRGNGATSFTFKGGNVLVVQASSTLTLTADIEDDTIYTCTYTVDDLSPPSDSNPVQPTVKPATPVLEVTDSTIFQGDHTTFTCTSDPAAPAGATYLFYQGDNVVQESQSNVYTISDAVTSQSGDYRCVVEFNDNESDDSNIVPLTVQLLPAELTIAPVPVEDGSDFTLTCDDRGNGATSFTFKGGNVLVVQASSTLTLTADIEDDTIYTCTYTVDDLSLPSDSNPVQPTVKPATPVLEVTDSTIFQGDDTTFTCTSDPAAPAGATYLFYQGDNVVQESQSNVYTISDAVTSQSGDYRCVVDFNDNESDDSNIVPLTVQLLPAELTIAPVPVEDGSDFTLTCDDRGNGATSFTFKGGNVLVVQASSTLTLTADIEDDTIYTCTYTVDDLSPPSDSNPVQPTVIPATPVLKALENNCTVIQDGNPFIFGGDDIDITCTSDPEPPAGATYQFYLDDALVQESTDTVYQIIGANTNQGGDYHCQVAYEGVESEDSNTITLIVLCPEVDGSNCHYQVAYTNQYGCADLNCTDECECVNYGTCCQHAHFYHPRHYCALTNNYSESFPFYFEHYTYQYYTCLCKSAFTGEFCESNINDCASLPCQNGGICIDDINKYYCLCVYGWEGVNCENVHH